MAPGTRRKLGAPILEPEVFRKQMCCIEESTGDIAGIFRRPPRSDFAPHSDLAPGKLCAPLVAPLTVQYLVETFLSNLRRV